MLSDARQSLTVFRTATRVTGALRLSDTWLTRVAASTGSCVSVCRVITVFAHAIPPFN